MPEREFEHAAVIEAPVSEEIREIISYHPHWMIRRGNYVFLFVLILLFLLAFFIRYPDVVSGSARLVAVNAPKTVVANRDGKLIALAVTHGQRVRKGQHLAYLESTADYKEVLSVYDWTQKMVNQMEHGVLEKSTVAMLPSFVNLGELQSTYQNVQREWREHLQFWGSGYYHRKLEALRQDLVFTRKLRENLQQQEGLMRQEQRLQQTEFDAYDSLAKDKVVAPLDVNAVRSKLIGKEQALSQSEASQISNAMAAHNKQKEVLDLEKQVMDQQQTLLSTLLQFKSETENWMRQYIISAPEEGVIIFITPLQLNELASAGQELFYLQPPTATYYAQLMAGQRGLGKVKEGQSVRFHVENYPSEEYGVIRGTVTSISGFPNRRDSFLIRVDLTQGLRTTYGKELFFRNNMLARGEIVTTDRTLLDRFFDPVRKVLQH